VRILAADRERLAVECKLPDRRLGGGAYDGRLYSPVLSDLLLQAPLVWARRFAGSASLPLGIGSVELYERLPGGAPFVVLVDGIGDAGTNVTCTVTACAPDGRMLQRFSGVSLVLSRELADNFVRSGVGTS
jgi:hypothetical protein